MFEFVWLFLTNAETFALTICTIAVLGGFGWFFWKLVGTEL